MRYLLILIFCLQLGQTKAQTGTELVKIIEQIEQNGDTISSTRKILAPNDSICEIRYFRTLKKVANMSKEEMFMKGLKPTYSLDSIKLFEYDENWKIKEIQLLRDRKSINDYGSFSYSSEEFQLTENKIYYTGKTNSEREIPIGIRNLAAQDYYLEIKQKGKEATTANSVIIENRSTKQFTSNIKFASGPKDIFLIIENSNDKRKVLKIQTVGYDLVQSDFVTKENLKKKKAIKFERNRDIFIEIVGNSKLLTIKNKKFETKLLTSKLVNKLEAGLLAKGKYLLELQNFRIREKRYCQIKIK